MLTVVIILGTFTEITSIAMITVPIFMPVIKVLKIDPIWFNVLMINCLAIGAISPPFGILLFTAKGYMPGTPLANIYRIAIPWCLISMAIIGIFIIFPSIIIEESGITRVTIVSL